MALNASTAASLAISKMAAIEASYKNGEKSPDDAITAIVEAIIEHILSDAEVIVSGGSSAGTYKVE